MKIAVIGGNLLGCATTLDLALVQEHDQRTFGSPDSPFSVTLFEGTNRLGGNALKSVRIDEELSVEVGLYRAFPLHPGTFLWDLISTVNDGRGTLAFRSKRFRIPGSTVTRRGSAAAAPLKYPWAVGSYGRLMRSFATWDWREDAYHMQHAGWPLLDFMHRVLNNNIWRSVALAGVLYAVRELNATKGMAARGFALAQVCVLFLIFLYSPRGVVASWQRHYSFWGTTLPMLVKHGITPAISRGSAIGFVKHLVDMNTKNVATCSISVGTLTERAGLEPYVRGSGDDYVRKFSYNRQFVERYLAPVVGWHYAGAKLSEVSSLAAHLALLDGDFSNSDVGTRISTVTPENASLCGACIEAARETMAVDVRLETRVTEITFDEDAKLYRVACSDGSSEVFDGVALCASPREGEMIIDTPVGTSLSELLGYDRDAEAAEGHAAQEADLRGSAEGGGFEDLDATIDPGACSHFAVVVGIANPAFFRLNSEDSIPDLVQLTHAPGVSRFERIRGVEEGKAGVYTVLCGPDFEAGGLFSELFEEGADLKYFEAMAKSRYTHTPVPADKTVDGCMPYVVLGNRFIYAAATNKLAIHPEMDAISAVNAASMFSKAVQWSAEEDKAAEDGQEAESRQDA